MALCTEGDLKRVLFDPGTQNVLLIRGKRFDRNKS